jgi:hypothetical protein
LESASWNNDKTSVQRLSQDEERLDNLYKKEQEKLQLLYEQQKESDNHASRYIKNQFDNINQLGCAFLSLLNNYYPVEKENIPSPIPEPETEEAEKSVSEKMPIIEPDMIFRSRIYDKFLTLEQKLIADKYLNEDLRWVSIHENGKMDIKNLIIFLVGLLDNNYFLPNKDPKIKKFFEVRYSISIGQNFEKSRRKKFADDYKVIFSEYNF